MLSSHGYQQISRASQNKRWNTKIIQARKGWWTTCFSSDKTDENTSFYFPPLVFFYLQLSRWTHTKLAPKSARERTRSYLWTAQPMEEDKQHEPTWLGNSLLLRTPEASGLSALLWNQSLSQQITSIRATLFSPYILFFTAWRVVQTRKKKDLTFCVEFLDTKQPWSEWTSSYLKCIWQL